MENFIVSARKYRPSTFQTVVGQQSITATLKNAINNNHLAQAYLFCGPRGVGKTTCARIFAKTINCYNLDEKVEPCNNCESCNAFNDNRSFNIHELDAASNNSVEDIRNLIDQVRIPPQVGNYSIYIIDEVHMLSQQAFNAFLKTLEEPPKHAIFILATTEKHKIIPTILSRCQIFDFNRIKIEDTVQYLEYIAKSENIEYERDAFNIIAQKADGAMRDALSIFDQVVSFSGNNITYQKVIENLNILDYDYYFKLTDSFLKQDISSALMTFNEILDKGFDAHNFINGLSEHFRNLLVCKDSVTLSLLEVGDNIKERYKTQTGLCSQEFLYTALKISNSCDVGYRLSRNKRLHVELALVELSNILAEKKKSDVATETKTATAPTQNKEVSKPVERTKTSVPVSKPKIQAPPKPSLQTGGKAVTSVSIKDLTAAKKQEEKVEEKPQEEKKNTGELQKNDFTEAQLVSKWNEFAEALDGKPRIYNTLISKPPTLAENHVVNFVVDNPLQEEKVVEIRGELMLYLREELSNDYIELALVMSDAKDEKKLYTSEDKFRHMAEKNDKLNKLKQDFNLDLI